MINFIALFQQSCLPEKRKPAANPAKSAVNLKTQKADQGNMTRGLTLESRL